MANKKIRVGVWGLGRAGLDMHCAELDCHTDKFEVVAGCDILPERLEELKKRYPKAKVYSDAEEFLADKKIDLIAVATPSLFHVDYDIRALEAGKYVAVNEITVGATNTLSPLLIGGGLVWLTGRDGAPYLALAVLAGVIGLLYLKRMSKIKIS